MRASPSGARFLRLVTLASILTSTTGCVQREYTWTRKEPAILRKSPTVFTVRIRLDRESGSVVWLEDARDAEGEIGREVRTLTECTILDDDNWQCPPLTDSEGATLESIEMRDGRLLQHYWGENRVYRTQHRALGLSL